MTVEYLADTAQSLLDAATAALVPATTGHPLPSAIFVSHGPPAGVVLAAGGCDLLAVHLEDGVHEPAVGDPTGKQSCQLVGTFTWVITLLRCHPGVQATPDELSDAASDLLIDLWALLTELYDRLDANTLIPVDDPCDIKIGEVTALEPEGRVAGWEVRMILVGNDAGPTGS